MVECVVCGKEAIGPCAQCGKSLCDDHAEHGINRRTNAPSLSCKGCHTYIKKKTGKLSLILGISFIIVMVIVVLYFNSFFGFLD